MRDVLIVGGGITGLLTAIWLAERGVSVAIVDAGQNAGTLTNAGSLHVQMQSRFMRMYPDFVPALEAALPFYAAASEAWVGLDQRLGPFELVREGGLMVAESESQLAFLEHKAEREAKKGLTVEILRRNDLERLAPWLAPSIVGAELCRNEGKLNPLVVNKQLRAHAASIGVETVSDGIDRVAQEGPVARAVGRSGRSYDADQIIIAAAWDTGRLVAGLGLAMPTEAEPLHTNITEAAAPQIRHLVQHAERKITLKQLQSGQIVIGGGWPARDRGPDTPPEVLLGSMLSNVALAARMVPAMGRLRIIRTWAGMNTTIDGVSTVGRVPGAERILIAVPGDAGYTLSPLVSSMAAAIALGEPPAHDSAPFTPARFAA